MKIRIYFASSVAASLLTIASSVPTASAEDEKEVKPSATQVQVPAPTKPPEKVTPETQVKGSAPPVIEEKVTPKTQVKGPAPPVARPQVKLPTETRTNPDLQQQAMDEKQKDAAQGAMKTSAYPLDAMINFVSEPINPLFTTPQRSFCEASSARHPVVVRLRYEWRPTTSQQYLPSGLLIVRRASGPESIPVLLSAGRGEARTDRRSDSDGRLTLPYALSKADLCPSGCTQVRLEARTSETKDRFEPTWVHACIDWRFRPGRDW